MLFEQTGEARLTEKRGSLGSPPKGNKLFKKKEFPIKDEKL